jgi:acetoacetyl-CoA synthetase
MTPISEGELLWEPTAEFQRQSNLAAYQAWLANTHGLHFASYEQLWNWSVGDLEAFWGSIWEYYAVQSSSPYQQVLARRKMPGAVWFPGATLNYCEHVFRHANNNHPALIVAAEGQPVREIGWPELERHVGAVAAGLRSLGVGVGDRVVAYLPNIPEAVIAFLACASIGALWSSCSPDFGSAGVIDRFQQIEPKLLIAVDGYRYGGKDFDRSTTLAEIRAALPSLAHTIMISAQPGEPSADSIAWATLLSHPTELSYTPVPFDHPLWILYSSGTTGLPKPIVQGHGGILLEHLKAIGLHTDVRAGDRFFWFTTTGWMMWNYLIGGLLHGATIVLYDGSPAWPQIGTLWDVAANTGTTLFGVSAGYISSCMKFADEPTTHADLSRLRMIGFTGSPLAPEGFAWIYQHIRSDIWLASISGGTDVCTAFVGGCTLLPVHAGEIQCRWLGAKVEAFDPHGQAVVGQVGELVLSEPLPSMPLFFWNDPEQRRYQESYFAMYPGIWRHGDWVKITPYGSLIISGRSDATINRLGVRIGSAEIYRAVELLPQIRDSVVLDLERSKDGQPLLTLFVVLADGATLDDRLRQTIRQTIRSALSPRHVPDVILEIGEVPRTISGKKLEVPLKRILLGIPFEQAINVSTVANPESLAYFRTLRLV